MPPQLRQWCFNREKKGRYDYEYYEKKKGGRSADLMVQALAEVYGNRDGLRPSG